VTSKSLDEDNKPLLRQLEALANFPLEPEAGRVLLIEGSEDQTARAEALEQAGHDVVVVKDHARASELVSIQAFDVLIAAGERPKLIALAKSVSPKMEALWISNNPDERVGDRLAENIGRGLFDVLDGQSSSLGLLQARVSQAVLKLTAERAQAALLRILHAQTQDLVNREVAAEKPAEGAPARLESLDDAAIDNISRFDPLTGLPNILAARDCLRKEVLRGTRYKHPITLALASIDGFAKACDEYGEDLINGTLRGIADMFSSRIREVDFLARLQGGEFMMLLPETDKGAAFVVIERIRQQLESTGFSGDLDGTNQEIQLTASFGIACVPDDTRDPTLLQEAAEIALDRAEESGNCVVLFRKDMVE
jgi:diguanylate cyclase (GGDEF)-like protein